MLRGRRVSELLIVEFCDTSDERGRFRKYSAFKVGNRIIPRYLQVSDEWMIKTGTRVADAEAVAADRTYLEKNPHESWLRDVFALAGIEYGRIDYGGRRYRSHSLTTCDADCEWTRNECSVTTASRRTSHHVLGRTARCPRERVRARFDLLRCDA
jgi:hypothetical protein